jgi:DNA-binding NarL/FixJ family response regulator
MKILIVDDEHGTRLSLAAAVERLGHAPVQAADGDEAWLRFQSERPSVVITDWAMPGIDGTELVRRIRADAEPAYTFVMMLTGRADEAAAREAMRAGADDVLGKPLEPAELERKLIAADRVTAMHERMLADARRDPLTGVGNRLRLVEDLTALCARVDRYGHAYCVALFGVGGDDDEALRAAGRALGAAIRSGDALYRCGARAFVVLLPEQAIDSAAVAAERLRSAAADAVGRAVSGGFVMTTPGDCTAEGLLAQAEAALARAVAAGGGQVARPDTAGAGSLRLLIADDDPVMRLMLGAIVKREAGFELVGEAADAGQAIELALHRRPDVVLLDVDMPGGGGARATVEIREALPDVRIVAISADDSHMNQYDMMRAGAVGFITKGSPDDEILRVIRSSARW